MGWSDCGLGALQAFYTGYAFNSLSQLPLASGLSRVWVFVFNCTTQGNWMQNAFCPLTVWAFPTLVLAHSFKNVVTVRLGRGQCRCEEKGHRTRLWSTTSGSCLYQLQLHFVISLFIFPVPLSSPPLKC